MVEGGIFEANIRTTSARDEKLVINTKICFVLDWRVDTEQAILLKRFGSE